MWPRRNSARQPETPLVLKYKSGDIVHDPWGTMAIVVDALPSKQFKIYKLMYTDRTAKYYPEAALRARVL